VFEVYRQVFHGAAKMVQRELTRKELIQLALEAEEEKERLQLVNKEQQQRIETLQYTTEEQSKQIQQNQHKVEYFDNTLQNSEAITIETIAKSLGTCPATLNKRLAACGFQYRSKSKQWFLKSPYDALGLHHDDTWTSPHGTHKRHYTKFFETGKLFITMLHNNNYDIRTTYKQYIAQQQQLATL
jgi:phage antirepressor YoqD-like protein